MPRVRDHLYASQPFSRDTVAHVEPDLTGWGSTHPAFRALFEGLRPELVIEVGSWKGGSAVHMAGLMREFAIPGEIVCVDTWLGAPIAWTEVPELKEGLRLHGGYPQLFYTFARNVLDAGMEDIITPLPAPSEGGHTVLKHFGVQADLIYIDADHDYEPVRRDLQRFFELLAPQGAMICDDFGCFPGVTDAVKAFAEEHNLFAIKQREKAILSRVDIGARTGLVSDGYWERRAA